MCDTFFAVSWAWCEFPFSLQSSFLMCSCYVPDRPCFPPFPLLPGWQTVAQAKHAEAASVWAVFNVANLQYDISLFDTSSSGSHVSCGSCPWCGGGCSRDVSPNLHPQTRHVTRNWAAWKQRCKNCQGHKTLKQQRKHTFGCDLLVFQEGIHFKFQTFSLICPCPNLASDSFIKSISHLFLFSSPNRKSFLWQKQSSKSLQGTERLKMKRTVARMSWANQFLDVVRLFHIFFWEEGLNEIVLTSLWMQEWSKPCFPRSSSPDYQPLESGSNMSMWLSLNAMRTNFSRWLHQVKAV